MKKQRTQPYNADEIAQYVSDSFSVRGADELMAENAVLQNEAVVEAEHAKRFADNIATLPPWQQILLIESEGPNIAASKDTTLQLYRQLVKDCESEPKGFYRHKHEDLLGGPHAIVWYAGDQKSAFRFNHELGHRIDHLIAKSYCDYTEQADIFRTDMASKPPEWQAPVDAFIKSLPKTNAASPREQALAEHLLKYPHHERRSEAFAEMNAMYDEVYVQHHGDVDQTAKILAHDLPDIWPAYRDYVMPLAQYVANDLMAHRHANLYTGNTAYATDNGDTNKLQYEGRINESPLTQQGVI